MDCKTCQSKTNLEESVNDAFFKSVIRRKNRENTLLFVLCCLLIVGFTAYAIYNKWVDSQYETVTEDVRVISENDGDANYIGNDGDITYYGEGTR